MKSNFPSCLDWCNQMVKILFYILFVVFTLIFVWDRLTQKYKMRYHFNFLVGKPGVGKSTFFTKLAYQYLKKGYHVYSSEPIKVAIKDPVSLETSIVETITFDPKRLYNYQFPENSVILIEEIGTVFNSRRFKTFPDELIEHFKRYRHDKCTYYICSQSMDCDATIRRVVSQYWVLEKYFRVVTVARRLIAKPVVVHPVGDQPSSIQDDFVEDPKLMRPVLGGMMLCFIPRWSKMFDSFDVPESMKEKRIIDYSDDPIPYEAPKHSPKVWVKARILLVVSIIRKYTFSFIQQIKSRLRIRRVLGAVGVASAKSVRRKRSKNGKNIFKA